MAFCPNCGTDTQGKFCAKCGSPMPAPAAPQSGPVPSPAGGGGYAPPPAGPAVQSAGLEENMASALCYCPFIGWLISILFLVIDPYKNNRTIRFHAFQSLFLCVALFVFGFGLGIVTSMMTYILHFLAFLFVLLYPLFGLAVFGLLLFLMYKAYNKEKFVIPLIGPLAEKQAGA